MFLYAIGLLLSSTYLIYITLSADTYIHIAAGLVLMALSSLLMFFKIEITITRVRIILSAILQILLVTFWCYSVGADWKAMVALFCWYLCAWCLSVFNRKIKGKT